MGKADNVVARNDDDDNVVAMVFCLASRINEKREGIVLFWRTSGKKSLAAPYPWQHHVDLVLRRLQARREFRDNQPSSVWRDSENAASPPRPHDTFRNSADTLSEEQSTWSEQALCSASGAPWERPEDAAGHYAWSRATLAQGAGLARDAYGWPCALDGSPATGFHQPTFLVSREDPHLPQVYPGPRLILHHLPPPSLLAVMSDAVDGLAAFLGWRRNRRRLPRAVARLSRSLWIARNLLYGFDRLASAMSLLRSNSAASGSRQVTRPGLWRGFLSFF